MDIQKKPTLAEKQAFWAEQLPNFEAAYWLPSHFEFVVFDMNQGNYVIKEGLGPDFEDDATEIWHRVNTGWTMWKKAINFSRKKAQAVPEGFVLVKKRNMIGNPNVDWLQAPKWAKYWLKDGHSNKYWWSSIRPVKDMDINAFCWRGDYFAKEAPDFSFSGPWDKSLTSRKAMIETQEPAND